MARASTLTHTHKHTQKAGLISTHTPLASRGPASLSQVLKPEKNIYGCKGKRPGGDELCEADLPIADAMDKLLTTARDHHRNSSLVFKGELNNWCGVTPSSRTSQLSLPPLPPMTTNKA